MKCHSLDTLSPDSILFIANHGTAFLREMDPDLILPASQEIYLEKTVLR